MFWNKKKSVYEKEEFYCNICGTLNTAYIKDGEPTGYHCGLCRSHDQNKPPIYDADEADKIKLARLENIYLGKTIYLGNSKWEAVAQVTVELAGSGEKVEAWRLLGEGLCERASWKKPYGDKGSERSFRFDTTDDPYPKWNDCTLRKLLNEVYFTENFTEMERSRILKVRTHTPNNVFYFSDCEKNTENTKAAMMGGPNTKIKGVLYSGRYADFYEGDKYVAKGGPACDDYVTIFSLPEYKEYYEYYQRMYGRPVQGFGGYWLRTPGYPMTPFITTMRSKMVITNSQGIPVYDGCIENDLFYQYCVRPVIYVKA